MKTSFLILLFILSSPILWQVGASDNSATTDDQTRFPEVPPPPQRASEFQVPLYRNYESIEELKDWAYNTSRFGGWTETVQFAGREIHYSVRTFTSGVATYELIFFMLDHRGKIAPFLAIPIKNLEMSVKVEGEEIVVYAFIDSELTPILSFSAHMLPRIPGKRRAQQGGADQPATAAESSSKGESKAQPKTEARSR